MQDEFTQRSVSIEALQMVSMDESRAVVYRSSVESLRFIRMTMSLTREVDVDDAPGIEQINVRTIAYNLLCRVPVLRMRVREKRR